MAEVDVCGGNEMRYEDIDLSVGITCVLEEYGTSLLLRTRGILY